MVIRLIFLLTLIMLQVAPAHASEGLTAEANRTELYEGDTLTLTVRANIKLEFNFGSLFDPGAPQLPMPDIDKLAADFDILSQNQKYSIRTINSDMHGEITWVFQLAPKRTGTLTIPSLEYDGQASAPIEITVRGGAAPQPDGIVKDAFIELATDKEQVYVQEQLVITLKLYFTGNLLRGELSEPEHPTALIEPLGNQREYREFRDNREYRVVERRYAVFPQEPGDMTFAPFRFEGQTRDASGAVKYLRDSAQLFTITVDAPPASFSGDTWLPASNLTLSEADIPAQLAMDTGDSLTRTLTVTASGLTSEALPPLPDNLPDNLRSYPDAPERQTDIIASGLEGRLTQSAALVAVSPGEVTLPEIRIPWWDTTTDTEKVAVLPAHTVTIRGTTVAPQPAAPLPASLEPASMPENAPAFPQIANNSSHFWAWLSLALAIAWAITLVLWLRGHRKSAQQPPTPTISSREREAFEKLLKAARNGKANTPTLLLAWANLNRPDKHYRNLGSLLRETGDNDLTGELEKLQSHYFGRSGDHQQQDEWQGERLVDALKRLRMREPGPTQYRRPEEMLPPLYPRELASRH